MSYLDESRFSTYDSNLKEWVSSQNTKTIPSSIYPWTKTAKAGVVSCYPVGGTELKPVVDFHFTETPPASGNKGPENPSVITGVSSVIVTLCETAGVDSTDYTLSLGSIYYGGSIDLSTGVMTVTHVKETIARIAGGNIFDSVVTFNAWSSAVIVSGEDATVCEELPYASGNEEIEHWRNLTSFSGTVGCYVYLFKSRLDVSGAVDPSNPTVVEWRAAANAYLAAHPLHFVFTLATPYTVQLTPTEILSLTQIDKYTPRLNTIYTDASSIQVGYVKSPIREEYELQQAIVSRGGNI